MQDELIAYLVSGVVAGGLISAGWAVRWLVSRIHPDPFVDARR